jgi:DeoR/GlpR family transcriptional regulator of sugar metabolism
VHFAPVAPVTTVHKLIIDDGISPEEVKAFEEKGIEVIIAK